MDKEYEKAENDLKALQSVGQVVGDVLKQLTEDHCKLRFIDYILPLPKKRFGYVFVFVCF